MLAKAISLIIRHRGKVIIKVNTQGKGQCRCSSVKVVGSECSEPGAVCATLEDCWDWRCIKAIISTKVRSLSWLIRGQEKRINREDPCCCDSVLDAMTQCLLDQSPVVLAHASGNTAQGSWRSLVKAVGKFSESVRDAS